MSNNNIAVFEVLEDGSCIYPEYNIYRYTSKTSDRCAYYCLKHGEKVTGKELTLDINYSDARKISELEAIIIQFYRKHTNKLTESIFEKNYKRDYPELYSHWGSIKYHVLPYLTFGHLYSEYVDKSIIISSFNV
jgi:hypothetical protein